jgi:hypothetical protein
MDSKIVIEGVRWVMNDLLRIYWQGSREAVARAIRDFYNSMSRALASLRT